MKSANSYVGQPIERVEDLRLVRGRGKYVDDVSRPNQLSAVILRSAVAHGRIKALEIKAARELPGVHAVITAGDIGKQVPRIDLRLQPLPELDPYKQPVLAEDRVRYVGEPIAIVLAESVAIGEDALDLIELDIEELVPETAQDLSGLQGDRLFQGTDRNSAITYRATKGDARAAFVDAPYTRRETFRIQRHAALPMEPRGFMAEWDEQSQKLTVTGAAKVPFANRRILARAIGLPEESIEMIEVDVGGGFGSRGEFYPEDFLIPFAAKFSGRPVKWTEDRREHLMASNHARDVTCDIEIACTSDGEILGLRGHAYSNIGAYIRTNGSVGPRNVAQFLSGPYRVPNIDIRSTLLLSNRTPSGTYRGPGRFEADFIRERIFDLASADLGIDRVQFRKRNLVSQNELPYPLATITPYESKTELDSGDYQVTLDKCLKEFGWTEKSALQGKLIDGRYHGIAVGCFIEGGAAGPQEEARCVLEPSGLVRMYVGSTSVGQGLETIMIQIAADALELPMERLEILHGSTSYVKEGYGSYHSRSTVMGGSALLEAATKLRGLMREAAASRLRCTPSELESSGVGFCAPSGDEISLSELAQEQLSAEAVFSNKKYSYAYGAHAAHVAVDPRTGRVEVLDYVATEDVGRMINPLTLHGQVIGAIVQGLGGTFLEHFVYDDQGQLLTGSFADYLLPVATDYPRIRAFTSGDYPCPHNPLGAKGAGEGGIISVGGVIANAVASALSPLQVQPFELPLSPNRVWAMINQAHAAQGVGAVDAAA